MSRKFDFSGWATKNNLVCSDGRVISQDAFKDNDGMVVPLVWNHQHNSPDDVLGHALLENREDGVYAYCSLNSTKEAKNAKNAILHGDISSMSIWANQLKHDGNNVIHGLIREVSLVLAGANPGAMIDNVIMHGLEQSESEDEALIYTGEPLSTDEVTWSISHSDTKKTDDVENKNIDKTEKVEEKKTMAENTDKTVKEVFDEMTEEQKTVVYAMIGAALEEAEKEDENEENTEGDETMKHNVFEGEENTNVERDDVLSHAEQAEIIGDAKRYGSLKESALQHGIKNVEYLFPEAKSVNPVPDFITDDQTWVSVVMAGVHKTPFSRIKSLYANITEDEARAKGYTKGKLKKDEVFSLLKRTTSPTTVYKKQKIDRDDMIDITDFDVVAWIKKEMRTKLDEELARAFLVGDGRIPSDDDKIKEDNIRPIWKDDKLYTVPCFFEVTQEATGAQKAEAFIDNTIRSRKEYKGSGNPTLFATEDIITECLMLKDKVGRYMYKNESELATTLRVKKIVTVPAMENCTREVELATRTLHGIIVNLADYSVGADKGGAVSMFDDFDIDYNAQKYLLETRCSGALTKPYSAIVIESAVAGA